MANARSSQSARMLPVMGFLTGTGLSLLGNNMALLAIPWFVLQTTGSASQTGYAGVAAFLPNAIAGVLGGPIVDRFGGRRVSVVSDIISGLAVLMIPVLYHLDRLSFPLLLGLIFVGAILDVPGVTARRMLLPGLQKRSGIGPERMNTMFEVLGNIASMVGPVLAGLLIALMGTVNLLFITAAGFAISASMVTVFVRDDAVVASTSKRSYVASIREGFAFIRGTPVLLAMAVLFSTTNFLTSGMFSVGVPVFVNDVWASAGRLGLIFTMLGVGNLVGGTLYGVFGHRLRNRRRAIMLTGFALAPLWMSVFVWSHSFPIVMAGMFLLGVSAGPSNPMSVTIRFEHIPEALRGRVFATFSAIAGTVMPLGIAISGVLIEQMGVRQAMALTVALYVVFVMTLPFINAFREMDRPGPFAEQN